MSKTFVLEVIAWLAGSVLIYGLMRAERSASRLKWDKVCTVITVLLCCALPLSLPLTIIMTRFGLHGFKLKDKGDKTFSSAATRLDPSNYRPLQWK
jgi:hypothetical protein